MVNFRVLIKNMAFKIETIKWSWPKEVKSPNVYRDDEFIVTSSKEEAIKSIDFLLNKPQGLTYTITVERDKKYYTYYRHSMPCYGGLVKYSDSHGKDKYWMNPYFPRDIKVSFPEGDIIFIGMYSQGILKSLDTPYNQFILSKESPWIAAFNNKKSIIFKDNYYILTDMDTQPTVYYSLVRLGGFGGGGYSGSTKKDWNPKADLLISKCKDGQADPRRICGQNPIVMNNCNWADNQGYHRPYNESIYKAKLPVKLKDFGKLSTTNYPPNCPNDNSYFLTTMKEKFGVDINKHDENLHQALIKSWSFFKKEAKNLSNFPDV